MKTLAVLHTADNVPGPTITNVVEAELQHLQTSATLKALGETRSQCVIDSTVHQRNSSVTLAGTEFLFERFNSTSTELVEIEKEVRRVAVKVGRQWPVTGEIHLANAREKNIEESSFL